MDYQFKSYSKGNKEKLLSTYFIFILYCSWLAYLFLSLFLGDNVVLFEWFPIWTISIVFAIFTGVIGSVWSTFRRPKKQVYSNFLWGGFLGLMFIVPLFDVLAYSLANKTVRYQTEYEIVSPGPRVGKSGRCEYGIWIKEIYTDRWTLSCIRDPNSKTLKNTGVLWVRVKTSPMGAYMIDYQFSR
ncbi:TPA: hypothetical protein ACS7XF_000335 [Providencia alcalifaciens]